MNSITIGKKIAKLRKEKGLTQSQLAEIINVSNKTISRWETGEGYPEISLLAPLAKALGVSTDFLLNEEPEPDIISDQEAGSVSDNSSETKDVPPKKHIERKAERFSLLPSRLMGCFRSLTIFNKISLLTAGLCVLSLIFSGTLIMMNALPSLAQLPLFSLIALRVGVVSAVLGIFLGLIDAYDRQYRAAVYLLIANIVLGIGIPILLTLGAFGIISIFN